MKPQLFGFLLLLALCGSASAQQCPIDRALEDLSATPSWSSWGADLQNTRFQAERAADLKAKVAYKLKLKWAFGIPDAKSVIGQPMVAGGRVFISGDNQKIYSLDADSGCTYWSFTAAADTRNSPTIGPAAGHPGRSALYFGDLKGNVYALDAANGELLWKTSVDIHPRARITASPKLYEDRLYVGVSSLEEAGSASPDYECCTFRGSVVALDTATGHEIWKTPIIQEPLRPTRKNSAGTQLWGPAGGGVWDSPTIDPDRHVLYVGTGDAYTEPAGKYTDAILALDLETGKIVWSVQDLAHDAWIVGCDATPKPDNCPKNLGPDYDFGASPILRDLPDGRSVLLAAQKSGMVWAHDPDRKGAVIWKVPTADKPPAASGQLVWGGAADEENAYFGLASGGVVALSLATGARQWFAQFSAESGRRIANQAAVSVIPGLVFANGWDGHVRAISTADGRVLWDFDTMTPFDTVNKVEAQGGSMGGPGPVIAGGILYVGSGYVGAQKGVPGNVLLAFSTE